MIRKTKFFLVSLSFFVLAVWEMTVWLLDSESIRPPSMFLIPLVVDLDGVSIFGVSGVFLLWLWYAAGLGLFGLFFLALGIAQGSRHMESASKEETSLLFRTLGPEALLPVGLLIILLGIYSYSMATEIGDYFYLLPWNFYPSGLLVLAFGLWSVLKKARGK